METPPLSTLTSARSSMASHLRRTQADATKIQAEVASGRLYDVGKSLGYRTEELTSFRQEIQVIQRIQSVNQQLAGRLDAAQAALNVMVESANDFLGTLMSSRNDPRLSHIVADQGETTFQTFLDAANSSFSGNYVFGGLNSTEPPFENYFAASPPSARAVVESGFVSTFGFASTDPAAATIPASSMQAYMDNVFAAQFVDPQWSANWTGATPEAVTSFISGDRQISTSVSAAEDAFRNMAAAFALIADAGTRNLNEAAYQAVADQAVQYLGRGISMMGELQGRLGTSQQEVERSTQSMSLRLNLLNEYVGTSESIDPSELSVRLNAMLNQLEASYAITGRLQNLSLLNAL